MGKTAIEWTDFTFNPWWGCVKISPACDNCYAAAFSHRLGRDHWGPHATYRTFGDKHWQEPLRWNDEAQAAGVRKRVFCSSMADVFDNAADQALRERLWILICATPDLDWLLLTKRPQNIQGMLPAEWLTRRRPNVWLGTTVENQDEADRRIPHLLRVPARVHFLSCEPLLGPLNIEPWLRCDQCGYTARDAATLMDHHLCKAKTLPISWVISGGESGPKARPSHPDWFRSLRDQCEAAGVAYLHKQNGEWAPGEVADDGGQTRTERVAWYWNGEWRYGKLTPRVSLETHSDDGPDVVRFGKKKAGRWLDGREHSEFPA